MKKRRQRKPRSSPTKKTETTKTKQNPIRKAKNANRNESRIIAKDFEIFVTDFLTDPCALPAELRDCVLVDGSTSYHDITGKIERSPPLNRLDFDDHRSILDLCASNNSQMLKKILKTNNDTMDRMIVEGKMELRCRITITMEPFHSHSFQTRQNDRMNVSRESTYDR